MAKASRVAAKQAQNLEDMNRKLDLIMEHLGIGKEKAEETEEESAFSYDGLTDDELNAEVYERDVDVAYEGEVPTREELIRTLQADDETNNRPAGRVSTSKDVFDGMTGAELRELADAHQVTVAARAKNADIAGALRAAGVVPKTAKK
jgi:hypothetical protein